MIPDIQIRILKEGDLWSVYRMIQTTIETSYREVYSAEAREFFKNVHNGQNILNDATAGYTIVAERKGEILGTGTLLGSTLRRVYVNPNHQHRGIGKLLARELEKRASNDKLTVLDIDATPVSRKFWESMGFKIEKEDVILINNGQKVHYYKMVKSLS
jgi:ribosomal protein S18 acetylase RimI-like enzyme